MLIVVGDLGRALLARAVCPISNVHLKRVFGGRKMLEIKIKEVDDVLGSIWLATAIQTYETYLINQDKIDKLGYDDFSFKQGDIQRLASKICTKTVQNARISQWCNADHPNSSHNYLREVGKNRRITLPGECDGIKEMPVNLFEPDEIIFEIPSLNQAVSFSELIAWLKNDFLRTTNLKPMPIDEQRKMSTSISRKKVTRPTINTQVDIPPANDYLRTLSIDFPKLILQTSYWVSKELFDFLTENNNVDAPGVFYPYTIRKQGVNPHWEEIDQGKRYLDTNHRAQNALSYSLVGKTFQAAFSEYSCCHIYGRSKDWKSFTCIGNIVLVPKSLKSLTDHNDDVMRCLEKIAYLRYNWKPDEREITIDDQTKVLANLVREVGISLEEFEGIWIREMTKHRNSYKGTFDEKPDF